MLAKKRKQVYTQLNAVVTQNHIPKLLLAQRQSGYENHALFKYDQWRENFHHIHHGSQNILERQQCNHTFII